MNSARQNLADKLTLWALSFAAQTHDSAEALCGEIYKLIFRTDILDELWDEPVLLRVVQVFDAHPPDEDTFGETVSLVRQRARRVSALNDLFYQALDGTVDGVIEQLDLLGTPTDSSVNTLRTKELNDLIRNRVLPPSTRLKTLLAQIEASLSGSQPEWLSEAAKCLVAVQEREAAGKVNSLLIHRTTNQGIAIALNAVAQDGTGATKAANTTTPDFEDAIDRARMNLVKCGFMPASQDAVLMGDLSDASYSGCSIALGAAIALFSSRSQLYIDPYTAFTGDIKLEDADWKVRGVQGIPEKLLAARDVGCRKIFLPADNEADIPNVPPPGIRIVPVHSIIEMIACLQLPSTDGTAESLQVRKVRTLETACVERGWNLSGPVAIQDASQFTVSPPTPPELRVSIYTTGAHAPKQTERPELQAILACLNAVDAKQVPLQTVQKTFILKKPELREQVRGDLLTLGPTETGAEAYCDYTVRFDIPPEKLVIKQFTSGKLNVAGRAGALYQRVLEVIVTRYNVHHPNAKLDVQEFLQAPSTEKHPGDASSPSGKESPPLPYIGTDESGKGDYFGPLVVAAVWVNETLVQRLQELGIRDSKTLSDKQCRELAHAIRETCRGCYEEVEILPERYNALYADLKREQKTLNHLLAWGHARALETLLARRESKHAIADQFGDESYIRSKLMNRGKAIVLQQTPKAERYLAVAAASVLARDRFLSRLEQAGEEFGTPLPKGASPAVVEAGKAIVARHGPETLGRLAKMHFKTTDRVLGNTSK